MAHAGHHQASLVVLSVLIAIAASYTALDLAARVRVSAGPARRAWLCAAAVAMGGGIWSMHFVGMLAFRMPGVDVGYDPNLTLMSLVLPVVVTALAFAVADRPHAGRIAVSLGGLVMGLGIAGMHYTGMAAMRIAGEVHYRPAWVALSILIAVGAAVAALRLAVRDTGYPQRAVSATLMGLAVSGMHYTAMRGAVFTAAHGIEDRVPGAQLVSQTNLAAWITATTFLILMLAVGAATFDRRMTSAAERETAALRESEERFRFLIQSVTDYAIFMLDVHGNITNWNAGAARIKGYQAHEILGSHISRFYTPEDLEAGIPLRALARAADEGRVEAEGWRVRKDGSRFWANVVLEGVRGKTGELLGYAKITRDITERKEAQEALDTAREALTQSQKMEALGQLTGGIAHDFNNLLMAVLGSLELIQKRLPEDPMLGRLLDNARQGAQRGAALTQRMLAFARRQELRPEAVSLSDLVGGMCDLLQSSIGPRVQIALHVPADLPRVMVDAHQCELALLNLVLNARDAMPDGGTIRVVGRRATPVEAQTFDGDDHACLAVIDTGSGMDPDTVLRAREPFFTTKGVGKGTGLGLSMVHGLAAQSKGRLVLVSAPGDGTTAEMWFPVAHASAVEVRARPLATPGHDTPRTLRVMAVDDDALVLENTVAMLEDLGHLVVHAHSGPEALAILDDSSVDLVVTDQAMPGMTGVEMIGRIKARYPNVKIVLASGYAELPANQHTTFARLHKPFDQDALRRAVASAVAQAADDRIGQVA